MVCFDMAAIKGHHNGSFKWMPDALRGIKWGVLCYQYAGSLLSVDGAAGPPPTHMSQYLILCDELEYERSSVP